MSKDKLKGVQAFVLVQSHTLEALTTDGKRLQVFALEGRGRVTSRAYSLETEEPWDLQAFGQFGSGTVEVSGAVWAMDSCWVNDINLNSQ